MSNHISINPLKSNSSESVIFYHIAEIKYHLHPWIIVLVVVVVFWGLFFFQFSINTMQMNTKHLNGNKK